VGKTIAVYVNFLLDVACQKLLKSANVSRSYSKHNTGTVFGGDTVCMYTPYVHWCTLCSNETPQHFFSIALN